jgi:hypothetical protein
MMKEPFEEYVVFRVVSVLVTLFLITLQLPPLGSPPPEEPKEESPVKGWWMVSYFAVPPTRYSKIGKGTIKAESLGTRSSLYRKVEEKEKGFPVLSWRWKISNVVRSAVETRTDRFDAAAKVIVVFSKDRGFTVFGGNEPQGLRIEYVWTSRFPKGQVFDHPGMKNCKIFVLESGEGKVGRWVDERRNLPKDFQTTFGIDFVLPFAIGIETDTDQSNERVTAFYSEPVLTKR